MIDNREMVNGFTDYDCEIVAEGLSIITGSLVTADRDVIIQKLDYMSDRYGGTGLVSVMDYMRVNR